MRVLTVPALALLVAGCALTTKATPVDVRYFSPEAIGARAAGEGRRGRAEPVRVAVGRVTSSAHLRSRIVYRESAFELGSYDDLRWTEYPEMYLRRSLDRALFHERGMAQAVGGAGPSLDVELIAFEEVRRGQERSGRVQIGYRLRGDREVLTSGVVTVERRAGAADGMSPVVAALASALHDATAQVAVAVESPLAGPIAK